MFAEKLFSMVEEMVHSFQHVQPHVGVAMAVGKKVTVPLTVHHTLEQILGAVQQGADKQELIPRVVEQLVKTSPEGRRAAVPSNEAIFGPETGPRKEWKNQLANQVAQPLQLFRPTSLLDASTGASDCTSIEAILVRALQNGTAVKAAGSGHSYSDVATSPDFLIDTHGLNRPSDAKNPITGQLSQAMLRSPLKLGVGAIHWNGYHPDVNRALFETEAGITIHDMNQVLEQRNLGLMNMGGYDGQTIIGATSTSTHGSGITLGPFPDMVRSLVIATTGKWNGKTVGGKDPGNGVYYYRIEPTDGITDPAKYADPLIQLIQDDDCFNATICSMGCFGVIYSVVFEVMQMYWLEENRSETTFDKLVQALQPNPANPGHFPDVLVNTRNFEVYVHPYPMDGLKVVEMDLTKPPETYYPYFRCLVSARNIVERPHDILGRSGHRNIISQMISLFRLSFELMIAFLNLFPELVPFAISASEDALVDSSYINKSYEIYNLGLNQDSGFAAEIGFSLEDDDGNYTPDHLIAAVNRIHRIAQVARVQGEQYQTSAFSLRFVKASGALLSMMHGRNTGMIEMDMVTGTYAGTEIMYRYETNMYSLGGRPHWGLEFDFLNGSNGLLGKLYSELETWLAVYRQFNGRGTFNSAFTDRAGFTVME
ncbi:D-arabinono-1,4-lactone oxidase [Chondromyces apiculatus]|uniref:FAD binding domain protein n=1 Tax=Chondromyces apiculatus DSM 436 TaxID=1192034 RepID=A0A017TEC0_9BACT|nr:D-arabinono-1,4-lactone oxidase [Chondromyces apiculatus]EYF07170.1 FAD binding domain protein [Chondromyces apiculatus DSM 436]